MSTFYNHHSHTTTTTPDHLHHTLIFMNPNFSGTAYHHPPPAAPPPPPPPPPSQNILLLNSAATAHQLIRPQHADTITLYGYPQPEARDIARDITRPRQGLSLTLSSQNPAFGIQTPRHHHHHHADVDADVAGTGGGSSLLGSKYLKAAQELLDEVVNVGHGLLATKNNNNNNSNMDSPRKPVQPIKGLGPEEKPDCGGDDDSGGGGVLQLSSAERQELQMKKAKLVTMLDEAEQRYRQYHNQMQIVIASFEQAAGVGSAKAYTALALKTISKQFRCLKDAIQAQIRAAGKSLGEGGGGGGGGNGMGLTGGKIEGSRLKYIDHQIRQQRALQQLGMMQNHNAWRPQRGLPERSVSVLRAWLFEHFLHPYPKDSDKIMLAKQTGLTRSQVSNWFINARVRLWKPMIEEMYSEEIKEQEQNGSAEEKASSKENSNGSNSATNIADQNQHKPNIKDQNFAVSSPSSSSPSLIPIPTSSSLPFKTNNNTTLPQNQHGFSFAGSLEMEDISQGSPKRARNEEVIHCGETDFIKFANHEKQGRDNHNNNGYPMLSNAVNFVGNGEELESYTTIGEMGRFPQEFQPARFFPGNGISLSLGLPPCENQQINLTATNHSFLSPNHNIHQFRRANEFGSMSSPPPHSTPSAFECLDIQNRKGFAAAQLLPDFVA